MAKASKKAAKLPKEGTVKTMRVKDIFDLFNKCFGMTLRESKKARKEAKVTKKTKTKTTKKVR